MTTTWTFLARPTKGGFKYFGHPIDGSIGIADNSGRTPDDTDHEPVFLDVCGKRHVEVFLRDNTLTIRIPVRDNGREFRVPADSIADLAWLIHEGHIDVRHVDIGESLRDVMTVASAVMAVRSISDVGVYREPVKKVEVAS